MDSPSSTVPKPVVHTHVNEDGIVDISVTGANGTLRLEVSLDGPTIAVSDLERATRLGRKYKYKFVCSLAANNHLKGWFVEKQADGPGPDIIIWIPAKKKRAPKKGNSLHS